MSRRVLAGLADAGALTGNEFDSCSVAWTGEVPFAAVPPYLLAVLTIAGWPVGLSVSPFPHGPAHAQ